MLVSFSADINVHQSQREQMAVMSFLTSLPSKFDTPKSQILSNPEIYSYRKLLVGYYEIQVSNAMVSKNNNH